MTPEPGPTSYRRWRTNPSCDAGMRRTSNPRLRCGGGPRALDAADREEYRLRDTIEHLADHFNLTEEERKELLPSGSQATFDNRVG